MIFLPYFYFEDECSILYLSSLVTFVVLPICLMPLAHELHELQHRGELVPTRKEIMGKIGASILLSY